jgi:hypothetical protein
VAPPPLWLAGWPAAVLPPSPAAAGGGGRRKIVEFFPKNID